MIPVNLLLVEDNHGDVRKFERVLGLAQRCRFAVDKAEWLSTALMALRNRRYDIIFLDLSLGDCHGIDTLVAVKREAPNTPIIVLSGQEDLNVATKAMEAGADNFIVKTNDLTTDMLEREVLYGLERSRRELLSKQLMQKSIERLTVDEKTLKSDPPPSVNGLLVEHINRIETIVASVRLFIQRNHPSASESVEQILADSGYYTTIQELRSLLHMDDKIHTRNTIKISERALRAVTDASRGEPRPSNPDEVLLSIIQGNAAEGVDV